MGIVLHQVGASGQRAGRGWKGELPAVGRGSSTFWLCRNVSSLLAGKGRKLFWCFQCSQRMIKWGVWLVRFLLFCGLTTVLRGCKVWGGLLLDVFMKNLLIWGQPLCCCFGLWLWGWGSKLCFCCTRCIVQSSLCFLIGLLQSPARKPFYFIFKYAFKFLNTQLFKTALNLLFWAKSYLAFLSYPKIKHSGSC